MEFKCKEFSLNHTLSSMKVGTDAILLSSLAERNHKKHILEIGTGCGIISLAMAQFNQEAKITAIDVDEESILQAQDNFLKSKWSERLIAEHISLQDFAPKPENHKQYDFIISNPPYFVNSLQANTAKRTFARHADKLPFSDFVNCSLKLATPDAKICVILPTLQSDELTSLFEQKQVKVETQINIYSKPSKPIERIIRTYSLIQTKQTQIKNVFIREENGEYSSQYKDIVIDILL
ncbi:MAG: methyltransferase [Bacteroidales bacterium]|nr:methyltransferase [Bacteroidales bacterium]